MHSEWLDFYRGVGTDAAGRYLDEILDWGDDELESVHDYIQWLFPLTEPSAFNPDAPQLTPGEIATAHVDAILRENVRAAYARMLAFYGLTEETADKEKPWVCPSDHNHLRLTRILKSLRLLGFEGEAQELYRAISRYNESLPARTKGYWREAVQ